ncbi:MAG: hypothetical protein OHK0012_04740 [Synechococcales cyanobacterium]
MSSYKTVYEILDALRRRPALFLGNPFHRHPFATLQAFLNGLMFSNLEPGIPSVWLFSQWITARIDGISTTLPWDWMAEHLGCESAYMTYFQYLDEYRACREIEVAQTRATTFVPQFWCADTDGNPMSPSIPDRIYIGQGDPSEVYFLAEVYGTHVEQCFPYQRSVADAIEEAQSRWGVSASAWSQRLAK